MILRALIHLLLLLLLVLVVTAGAEAKPRHHRHYIPMVGKMVDDSQPFRGRIHRKSLRHRHFLWSTTAKRIMPPGLSRVMAEGADRVVAHPAGCPWRAFCGCGASVERFGRSIRSLWRAANWLRFPRAEPAPGRAAVRPDGHHIVILRRHIRGSTWLVYDANSGRHRTRIHPRSIAGWTIVDPRGDA